MGKRFSRPPFIKEDLPEAGTLCLFSCYIGCEPWQYALVTRDQMAKVAGDPEDKEATGLCDGHKNRIYIRDDSVSHPVVIHELGHAFMSMNLVHSAGLSGDQVEEVMCDILAFNWCRIVLTARIIVNNLLCFQAYLGGEREQDWYQAPIDVINNRLPEHLLDLIATYTHADGFNPLLRATIGKKKRPKGRF